MLLIRHPSPLKISPAPAGVVLRQPSVADTVELGRLYYESYPPGVACDSEVAAIEDIRVTFEGEYGPLSLTKSFLAVAGQSLFGAVLVVDRAPWPNTPDCPFIIELFTAPAVRRQGLAKTLLSTCLQHPTDFALQVAPDNTPAVELYESLSFQPG
ncbi:GNAT family N-acetyltransferase [Kribbella sp. NPDC006257]|uniref:GNAT family N-acetyltransferase n=1 Tax=Kribbella sp. NPDC006257 TaxID=3156738 RepID=UPI0033ACE242